MAGLALDSDLCEMTFTEEGGFPVSGEDGAVDWLMAGSGSCEDGDDDVYTSLVCCGLGVV